MESLRGFVRGMKANLIDSSILDTAKYEVTNDKLDGYEERHYPPAKWVCTRTGNDEAGGEKLEESNRNAFWKLFNFISSENSAKQKIEMTVPVFNRVVPGQGPACESHGEMCFFIPHQFQEKCPEPENKEVYIQELPDMTCYVSQFSGRIKGDQWFKHAEELAQKIERDGKSHEIDDRFWFFAGYNSPAQMFNRRNEILYVKKTQ